MQHLTPFEDINLLLEALLAGVQAVLGNHLVGMYLEGSLAGGDFDQDSDIDFVVVTEEDISPVQFAALQAVHDRLAGLESPWAIQLEGFYLARHALRRYAPPPVWVPNIERGHGERLKMVSLDRDWDIHRSLLRAHGIILAGSALDTLIEPVSADQVRQAVQFSLSGWVAQILENPEQIGSRGGQSYTVLTLCRILYTMQQGEISSKRVAALWAQETLGEEWRRLIESAWEGRSSPGQTASAEAVKQTQAFIRYVLAQATGYTSPAA